MKDQAPPETFNWRRWLTAEWCYLLCQVGWRKYCQPCDQIYWGWGRSHSVKRGCHCAGLWRL